MRKPLNPDIRRWPSKPVFLLWQRRPPGSPPVVEAETRDLRLLVNGCTVIAILAIAAGVVMLTSTTPIGRDPMMLLLIAGMACPAAIGQFAIWRLRKRIVQIMETLPDRFCPDCGYSLEGHADGARCPECGRDAPRG